MATLADSNETKTNSTGSLTLQNVQDENLKFNEESSDIKSLLMSNAIYDRFEMDWYTKFSRFGIIDPYNTLTTTREFVFITKPDLCLLNTTDDNISPVLSNQPFFVDAINRYRGVAKQLQSSAYKSDGPFMAILSNSLVSSLDLPGLTADTIETASNILGTKISYRAMSKGNVDFDFNLEFEDTKYLDVYMLFKMYDEYERLKWTGYLDFSKATTSKWTNYIINKVLHDQVTMYKFVVSEDGYRIIYYARITGCFPTSTPRDAFSDMNNNDTMKLTVSWKGHFVRDMDPIIISHFNQLVSNKSKTGEELPLYNTDNHCMEGKFAITPYIEIKNVIDSKHGEHREYFLKWKG